MPLCYDLQIEIKTNDFLKEINYFLYGLKNHSY